MKFMIVLAALVAVAAAKPGLIGTTLVGPSGTIVSSPGVISAPGWVGARSILAPGLIGHPDLIGAPGLIGARSIVSSGLIGAPGLVSTSGLVLANPGVSAGTVVAPGATLVGPSTNGLSGAVITNGLLGQQILV